MNDLIRYFERFSVDDPGKWFRILPMGEFQRFGRDVSIGKSEIADMLANFTAAVPETGVPVTTAHTPEAGKVGDIAGLEAREDGLYAKINWLERGLQLIKDGAFQFFSPEIFWGEVEHEGRVVRNILMGLSLVNDPFFGKATAVFSLLDKVDYREFSPEQRRQLAEDGKAMPDGSFPIVSEQDLQNAVSAWGRSDNQAAVKRHIMKRAKDLGKTDLLPEDWEGSTKESNMSVADELKGVFETFGFTPKPALSPVLPTETAEYKALADDKKKLEEKVAEQEKTQRITANVEKFSTALKVDKFEAPKGLAEKFAAVAEADAGLADELIKEFKALIDQAAQGKLFGEFGSNQPGPAGGNPAEQFVSLADAKVKEMKISQAEAFKLVAEEQPKLYDAYRKQSAKPSGDED